MDSSSPLDVPSSRRWLFLVGGRVVRREDGFFSSEGALSVEKMAFSRRRARCPSRRWLFLVGGRVVRREDGFFSSEGALSVEKMVFSRSSLNPIRSSVAVSGRMPIQSVGFDQPVKL